MPTLALTIGDAPQATVKALLGLDALADVSLAVIGDLDSLMKAATTLNVAVPQNDRIAYHDCPADTPEESLCLSLEKAVQLIAAGQAKGLVTGQPCSAGLMEKLTREVFNAPDTKATTLVTNGKFRLLPLTRDIAPQDIPAALAQSGAVARPLKALIRFLRDKAQVDEPCIALLGLPPETGANATTVETKNIKPVIHAVNAIGASRLDGCFAPDEFWASFNPATTSYDAVVVPAYAQGSAQIAAFANSETVSLTLNLPFPCVSTNPATATDESENILAALRTAINLTA